MEKTIHHLREKSLKEYYQNPNKCLCCGEIIHVKDNQRVAEVRKKKFCNSSCASKYNNKNIIRNKFGNNNQNRSYLLQITDEQFINIIKHSNNIVEVMDKIGYSRKTSKAKFTILEKAKELNINTEHLNVTLNMNVSNRTKGEIFDDRSDWQSARSGIRRDAQSTYNKSDKPKYCIVCGYTNHYDVCHIKPVSEFENDTLISEINDLDNLIALCPNHHWEFDNGYLTIEDILKEKNN